MPCTDPDADAYYDNLREFQRHLHQLCRFTVFVDKVLKRQTDPVVVTLAAYAAATDIPEPSHWEADSHPGSWRYQRDLAERLTVNLCATLKAITAEQQKQILGDAKQRISRDLANWWEDHQEKDRIREAKEAEETRRKKRRHELLAAMTDDDLSILGLSRRV